MTASMGSPCVSGAPGIGLRVPTAARPLAVAHEEPTRGLGLSSPSQTGWEAARQPLGRAVGGVAREELVTRLARRLCDRGRPGPTSGP